MFWHAKIISFARPIPTRRASLCVPPNPGIIPRPHSGCPNNAFSEAIRISQAMEISHPPPNAKPFTAAIVTWRMFCNLKNGSEALIPKARPSAAEKFTISEMSAPATNGPSTSKSKLFISNTSCFGKCTVIISLNKFRILHLKGVERTCNLCILRIQFTQQIDYTPYLLKRKQ